MMVTHDIKNNGVVINVQLGIFFQDIILKPEKELWQPISTLFSFDTPIIAPVPLDENLGDVPVVQATVKKSDSQNQLRISIAHKRMDIIIDGYGKETYTEPLSQLTSAAMKIIGEVEDSVKIPRIGLIVRSFYADNNPNETLSGLIDNKLKNKHGKKQVVDLFVRYVTRDTIKEIDINNYSEYQPFTARIVDQSGTSKSEGILLTRDINTSPAKNYLDRINSGFIKQFIENASSQLKLPEYKLW